MSSNFILGLGNDIIEIQRFRDSIERHGQHLLSRLFTVEEQNYCFRYKDSAPHFAGRFAAKEAIVKALGTGFGSQVSWHDVSVLNDPSGKPVASFSAEIQKRFGSLEISISISHCEAYATAVAIWICTEKK